MMQQELDSAIVGTNDDPSVSEMPIIVSPSFVFETPRTPIQRQPVELFQGNRTNNESVNELPIDTCDVMIRENQALRRQVNERDREICNLQGQFQTLTEQMIQLQNEVRNGQVQGVPIREPVRESRDFVQAPRGERSSVVKPDVYSGAVPFEIFLTQFRLWAIGFSDQEKLVCLISLLRAPVLNLLDTLPSDYTFEVLVDRIMARYGMRKTAEQYMLELRQFQLTKQTNYYGQLLALQDLVARSNPTENALRQEELTLSYFLNALKVLDFGFYTIFTLKNFQTVTEAGVFLLDYFRFSEGKQMASVQTRRQAEFICCSCGNSGHLAQFCRNNRAGRQSENC